MTTTKRKQSCFGSTVEIQIRQFFQQLILFRWEHLQSFRRERKNEVISEATQLKKCRTRSTCDAMLATWSNLHLSAFFGWLTSAVAAHIIIFCKLQFLSFPGKGNYRLLQFLAELIRTIVFSEIGTKGWWPSVQNGSLTGRLESVEQVFGKKASLQQQQQQLQTIG